jgi:putative tryptophan/tyrosine transport system substrate-binding protein
VKRTGNNMKRKITVLILGAMLFALCGSVDAQQPGKVARIGYLDVSTASASTVLIDALRQELSKLGWVEGKNIAFEYRFAEQKQERLSKLASELAHLNVDVIVATGGGPGEAAKASSAIPIVLTGAQDAVASGLVASLARPGGNVTGLSAFGPELNTKRLEVIKDAIPKLARVGLLWNVQVTSTSPLELKELRAAATALKVNLEEIETAGEAKSIERAFQFAKQKQVGAIMTGASRYFLAEKNLIVELANKNRLPAIYHQRAYVDQGGLMSYGVDYIDLYRRAAGYVDKILRGAKPSDLPVQQASKFEFVVNLKAAKQIGLTLSPEFLARANQVIK